MLLIAMTLLCFGDKEEHEAYLGLNAGPIEGGITEIRMFEMSWDGLELQDEGQAGIPWSGS